MSQSYKFQNHIWNWFFYISCDRNFITNKKVLTVILIIFANLNENSDIIECTD